MGKELVSRRVRKGGRGQGAGGARRDETRVGTKKENLLSKSLAFSSRMAENSSGSSTLVTRFEIFFFDIVDE